MNQVRLLVVSQKWELVAIGLVTAIYHLGTVTWEATGPLPVFQQGALGYAGCFVFLVICGYWAIRVWDGLGIGMRSAFFSYPAGRSYHMLLRVAAGALILISVVVVCWMLGAAISEILAPGGSWLTSPDQKGGAWPISFIGILNAYLYGSILAFLFRKPEVWFVFWVPVSVSVLSFLSPRLGIAILPKIFEAVFWYPTGMYTAFGFAMLDVETGTPNILPDLLVVLMWTLIFSAVLYFCSRIHRED